MPNKAVFAILVSCGELFIGLALIVGLATRYAAIAGALMVAVWFMIFVILATIHAGRIHSVDTKLADRFRFLA